MAFSKKSVGVIYLERNSLYFYGANIANIIKFEFPPQAVRDLDVVNKDLLSKQIGLFIDTNKIHPSRVMIILSPNIVFEKVFPLMEENKLEIEIQKYLDNIPFENVITKKYVVDKTTKIIVVNKLLYEIVKNAFEQKSFMVEAIAPFSSLKINPQAKNNFSAETAKLIINKFDSLKQDGMSINQENPTQTNQKLLNNKFLKDPKNKRGLILIFIFVLLVIVLVILFVLSGFGKPPIALKTADNTPSQTNTNIQAPTPTNIPPSPTLIPSETPQVGTVSSQLLIKRLKINILNSSGVIKQADFLKERLIAKGFENIITNNSQPTNSTKTLIIFLRSVPDDIKKTITDEVKKINFDVSVQENSNSDFDCTIVIGKQS